MMMPSLSCPFWCSKVLGVNSYKDLCKTVEGGGGEFVKGHWSKMNCEKVKVIAVEFQKVGHSTYPLSSLRFSSMSVHNITYVYTLNLYFYFIQKFGT